MSNKLKKLSDFFGKFNRFFLPVIIPILLVSSIYSIFIIEEYLYAFFAVILAVVFKLEQVTDLLEKDRYRWENVHIHMVGHDKEKKGSKDWTEYFDHVETIDPTKTSKENIQGNSD